MSGSAFGGSILVLLLVLLIEFSKAYFRTGGAA